MARSNVDLSEAAKAILQTLNVERLMRLQKSNRHDRRKIGKREHVILSLIRRSHPDFNLKKSVGGDGWSWLEMGRVSNKNGQAIV